MPATRLINEYVRYTESVLPTMIQIKCIIKRHHRSIINIFSLEQWQLCSFFIIKFSIVASRYSGPVSYRLNLSAVVPLNFDWYLAQCSAGWLLTFLPTFLFFHCTIDNYLPIRRNLTEVVPANWNPVRNRWQSTYRASVVTIQHEVWETAVDLQFFFQRIF